MSRVITSYFVIFLVLLQITNYCFGDGTTCDGITPCVKLEEANKKYMERCRSKGVSDYCSNLCRYDVDKKEVISDFSHHKCNMSFVRPMVFAAANDKDNTRCCTQQGVLDDQYAICEPFCNPASPNWPQKAESKYMKCLNEFEYILKCHWASATP